MTDWLPLREYLQQDIEAQIDDAIRHDPDSMMRATLAAHRDRIIEFAVDKVELIVLRRALQTQRARPAPAAVLPFASGVR